MLELDSPFAVWLSTLRCWQYQNLDLVGDISESGMLQHNLYLFKIKMMHILFAGLLKFFAIFISVSISVAIANQ